MKGEHHMSEKRTIAALVAGAFVLAACSTDVDLQ